jgi:hypothetical protein
VPDISVPGSSTTTTPTAITIANALTLAAPAQPWAAATTGSTTPIDVTNGGGNLRLAASLSGGPWVDITIETAESTSGSWRALTSFRLDVQTSLTRRLTVAGADAFVRASYRYAGQLPGSLTITGTAT